MKTSHRAISLIQRRHVSIIGSFAGVTLCYFLLSGCGAGTGQSLSSPTLSSRANGEGTGTGTNGVNAGMVLPAKRVGLFVTDYAADKSKSPGIIDKPDKVTRVSDAVSATSYDHVWVTVYKVELLSSDDQTFPLWSSESGQSIDLASLRDAQGERVALLGGVPIPSVTGKKSYKRARITFGKSLTFVKNGEAASKPTPVDDSVGRDDEGRPVLTMTLDRPRDLGSGKEDLVLAFDRKEFKFIDGRVTPSVREARGGINLDPARQEAATVSGVVAESAAGGDGPERLFAVVPDGGVRGENYLVFMRSSVPFFNANGKPSPTLVDGGRVNVRGKLDKASKRFIAESVTVLDAEEKAGDTAQVAGNISGVNADGGTLAVTTQQTVGWEPNATTTSVTLAEGAVLRSDSGLTLTKDEFFAQAKKAGVVAEFDGDYEAATNVLTARRARLVDATSKEREAEIVAVPKSTTDKSLTVAAPLVEWDGIVPPASGKAWTVNTTNATVCKDKDGKSIALAELLKTVNSNDRMAVRVIGTYAGGAITASRLELRPTPAKEEVAKKDDATPTAGDAKKAKPAAARRETGDITKPELPSNPPK